MSSEFTQKRMPIPLLTAAVGLRQLEINEVAQVSLKLALGNVAQ
jgi:hypothetical protein